jgi:hypothetical protein
VAKIFIAILASVALASGVGGDVAGTPNGIHAAVEHVMQDTTTTKIHLHIGTSLLNDHPMPLTQLQNHRPGCGVCRCEAMGVAHWSTSSHSWVHGEIWRSSLERLETYTAFKVSSRVHASGQSFAALA